MKLKDDSHLENMFRKVNEHMRALEVINAHEWMVKIKEYLQKHYEGAKFKDE